jgi:catechol 2,3-dioxygenase-like lactoylglutathione lyase family enzyme
MAAVLDQLNLVSRDIDATIGFYRLLGVKLPKKAVWRTANGAHHVSFPLANGLSLDFDSPALARAYNKGYRSSARGGNVVIGFSVKTRRSVDNTYAKLTKAGHRGLQPPWDAFWGSRYAIVADPNGNHIGIMSPVDPKKRSKPPSV